MSVGRSQDYEEAINEAVEGSFAETAKVSRLDGVDEPHAGTVTARVNVFNGQKTRVRVNVSRDGGSWVAKVV